MNNYLKDGYSSFQCWCASSFLWAQQNTCAWDALNILSLENGSQDIRVSRLISHPKYRRSLKYHDTGLT